MTGVLTIRRIGRVHRVYKAQALAAPPTVRLTVAEIAPPLAFWRDVGLNRVPAVSWRVSSEPPPRQDARPEWHDGLGVVSRWSGLTREARSAGRFQLMEDDRHGVARNRSQFWRLGWITSMVKASPKNRWGNVGEKSVG